MSTHDTKPALTITHPDVIPDATEYGSFTVEAATDTIPTGLVNVYRDQGGEDYLIATVHGRHEAGVAIRAWRDAGDPNPANRNDHADDAVSAALTAWREATGR